MSAQPLKIAIMAMGGEGGGVLADWIVDLGEQNGHYAQTTSVPGVAQRTGATIYYVELFPAAQAEADGARPVLALMPLPGDVDVVLARGERPEWGSDKESRRREVARSYRVLLLLGDDLNDFVSAFGADLDERRRLAEAASARWGTSWFVLPNPLYGSWERALVGAAPQSRPADEVRAKKRAALRGFERALPPAP
jgi:predicted secreted acid phosphatase